MAAQACQQFEQFDFGSEEGQDTELTLDLGDEKIVIEPNRVLMESISPLPGMKNGLYYPRPGISRERFLVCVS